jgi:hypothetical protein
MNVFTILSYAQQNVFQKEHTFPLPANEICGAKPENKINIGSPERAMGLDNVYYRYDLREGRGG